MKLHHTAAAFLAGTAFVLMLTPALAETYSDPNAAGAAPAQDVSPQKFSNTGSDPGTELPYAATVGRPPYAQGGA